ncbi:MAG: amidohydrolase family protein [Gemmatimonadaceae bacterium]
MNPAALRIDCHTHISAFTPAHGFMSRALAGSIPFRYMRSRLGITSTTTPERAEALVRDALLAAITGARSIDAAVVLAMDAVYDGDGRLDRAATQLYVRNQYVEALARTNPRVLVGASVHPFRRDAVRELERCIAAGAALLKWLPVTQGFSPADERCLPLYDVLAHHGVPLLSHTGGERTTPVLAPAAADPALLAAALDRGVTVIAAHCGARSRPSERSYVATFVRMAREHERFFGDTSALNLPLRWYVYDALEHDEVRAKLVHGSDWPLPVLPPPHRIGVQRSLDALREANGIERDAIVKRALGFGDDYWVRAAHLLRLPTIAGVPR